MATKRQQPKEYFAQYREKHREKLRLYQKVYKLRNRSRLSAQAKKLYKTDRTKHLRQYGMTQADYDVMLVKQHGRCAICGTDNPGKRPFNVDHCHATGSVRGLLCGRCNSAIGFIRDDIRLWRNICNYLWTPWNKVEELFIKQGENNGRR